MGRKTVPTIKMFSISKRQRLQNVIDNKPVDHVPCSFWFHFIEKPSLFSMIDRPSASDVLFEGQKNYVAEFDPDFVKVMSDGYFTYPDEALAKGQTVEEWKKVAFVPPDHKWVRMQVEHVKRLTSLFPDTPMFYNFFSPSCMLRWTLGKENYLRLILTAPEAARKILSTVGESVKGLAKAVISEGGADGLYYIVQNPDMNVVSSAVYTSVITPSDKMVLDAANAVSSNHTLLHICGYAGVKNDLSIFTSYESAIVNWAVNVEGVSLKEGKSLFGGRAVMGGFPNTVGAILETGSRDEVQSFTKKLTSDAGSVGVIIAADCSLRLTQDVSHLFWVREALEN
ncbi:putative uroporphyrinogen decarboxylase [Blattamonas nauphoetae]|uniref:Uroporphyrinogen decarboxylase n=1 Tax=Blattamonas nauphoetae TaxID=2049346 RepID=A0ABQ9Y5V1_9EUKA|nr:putative uroporphyrinogen decarboxylase [Blattamonas nauphoetae]